MSKKYVVIGNGIAGVTFARELRKRDAQAEILLVSGESEYFFSRTALMYVYMGHMTFEHTKPYEDWFWSKNRIGLKQAWVNSVDFNTKVLHLDGGEMISYDILILATGSKPNKFAWPGENLQGVQGLYSLQDLQLMESNTEGISGAVVVGGGLIGIEMAEMLLSRGIKVTFLVRERNFWDNVLPLEEAQLVNRHILEHHVDLRLETELKEIIGDEKGRVKAVKTSKGEEIPCGFVGLTVGVSPNIGFLKGTALETNRGILVDESFRTNMQDVYAIGDCAEFRQVPVQGRKQIEQVWYTGRMHGETLAAGLAGSQHIPYRPGIWFNSAKFFDIEYQTYGDVPPSWSEEMDSFYWEDKHGKICLRLLWDKKSRGLIGVNAFGWRLRHAYFDKAIAEARSIEKVMQELPKADFDPEFYKRHYQQVLEKFNKENGTSLSVRQPSFFQKLIGLIG